MRVPQEDVEIRGLYTKRDADMLACIFLGAVNKWCILFQRGKAKYLLHKVMSSSLNTRSRANLFREKDDITYEQPQILPFAMQCRESACSYAVAISFGN